MRRKVVFPVVLFVVAAVAAGWLILSPERNSPLTPPRAEAISEVEAPGATLGDAIRLDEKPSEIAAPSVDADPVSDPVPPAETRAGETRDEKMARLFAEEPALLDVLDDATNNPDPQVRQEAEEFLAELELDESLDDMEPNDPTPSP